VAQGVKQKTQRSEKQNNEVTVSCENAIRSYLSTHKLKTENIEPHLEKRRTKKNEMITEILLSKQ
jgi:hypothetical protein